MLRGCVEVDFRCIGKRGERERESCETQGDEKRAIMVAGLRGATQRRLGGLFRRISAARIASQRPAASSQLELGRTQSRDGR
jgi:hypothetical protein